MIAERIRKQVYDLTVADFARYAVWEYALDEETEEGQDEATVRPLCLAGVLDPSDGGFVVAAKFELADGSHFDGFLTPPPAPGQLDLGLIQPCILVQTGQVSFWCGLVPLSVGNIAESYARLGKSSGAQVFPVRFESSVPLRGGAVKGEIPGFLKYEWGDTERVLVVK